MSGSFNLTEVVQINQKHGTSVETPPPRSFLGVVLPSSAHTKKDTCISMLWLRMSQYQPTGAKGKLQ